MLSHFAFADETGTISTLSGERFGNDISVEILKTLFGGLPLFETGVDSLQNAFMVFNLCVLTVGGILAAYNLALSLVATANEGRMLGGYNATMTPIRSAFAVVMTMPVANGYCLIQVVVMWLVMQGVHIADIVWSKFVSEDNLAQALAVAPLQTNAKDLARNVLTAALCMSVLQNHGNKYGDNNIDMAWSLGYGKDRKVLTLGMLTDYVKENKGKSIELHAGNVTGGNGIADNACGTLVINSVAAENSGTFDGLDKNRISGEMMTGTMGAMGVISENNGVMGKIVSGGTAVYSGFRLLIDSYKEKVAWNKKVDEMSLEHAVQTENLLLKASQIADAIVTNIENEEIAHEKNNTAEMLDRVNNSTEFSSSDFDDGEHLTSILEESANVATERKREMTQQQMSDEQIFKAIDNLAMEYQTAFRQKVLSTEQHKAMYSVLVSNANEYGWFMAGAFFPQFGALVDTMNQIALDVPKADYATASPERNLIQNFNSKYLSKLNYYFASTENYKNSNYRLPTVDRAIHENNDSTVEKFVNSGMNISVFLDGIVKSSLNMAISDQEHIIMQLKRLGGLMITAATMIITSITTGLVGDMSSTAVTFFISMFAFALVGILYTGGITMSYVLPMLPVLIWLGMCFGWLVMVIQAMIASPLWIIMHLSPHKSDDFIGSQRNGYMLVLSLIVRPVLMVLGFIAALLATTVLSFFINNFFLFIYSMSQVGTNGLATALFGLIVVPLMYCAIVYIALKEMLNIMHKVPDELLSWFGGSGASLGQYGQQMSHGSIQAFGVAHGAFGQQLGSLKGAHAQMQGNINDEKAREEQRRLQAMQQEEKFRNDMNEGYGIENDNTEAMSQHGYAMDYGLVSGGNPAKAASSVQKNVPAHIRDNAIYSINKDLMNTRSELIKDGKTYQPISNEEYANRINNRIGEMTFGADNYRKLSNATDMLSNVSGDPTKGKEMMNQIYKTISSHADRNMMPYEESGQKWAENTNAAFDNFMKDRHSDKMMVGDYTQSSVSENDTMRKEVGSIHNVLKNAISSKNRDNPYYENIAYQNGKLVNTSADGEVAPKDSDSII